MAASVTLRAMGPPVSCESASGTMPSRLVRPTVGRIPVKPGETVIARMDGAAAASDVADEDGLVGFVATVAWADVVTSVSFTAVSGDGVESEPLTVVPADVIDP